MVMLPTIFQMIWGRPKLVIGFGVRELDGSRVLQYELLNPVIKNRFLRWLGVRRMAAEDIITYFSIEDYNNQRLVFAGKVPDILKYNGTSGAQRISLPTSFFPALIPIVLALDEAKAIKVFEEDIILQQGKYCAIIVATMEGKKSTKRGNFVVSETHPFIYWEA